MHYKVINVVNLLRICMIGVLLLCIQQQTTVGSNSLWLFSCCQVKWRFRVAVCQLILRLLGNSRAFVWTVKGDSECFVLLMLVLFTTIFEINFRRYIVTRLSDHITPMMKHMWLCVGRHTVCFCANTRTSFPVKDINCSLVSTRSFRCMGNVIRISERLCRVSRVVVSII